MGAIDAVIAVPAGLLLLLLLLLPLLVALSSTSFNTTPSVVASIGCTNAIPVVSNSTVLALSLDKDSMTTDSG